MQLRLVPSSLTPRRLTVIFVALTVTALAFCAVLLLIQARSAQDVVARMRRDAATLQAQASAFDLRGAATTMTRLRGEADEARDLTDGPVWAVGRVLPVVGDDVSAARSVSAAVASVLDAAQPLEPALPRLDPAVTARKAGRLDVAALGDAAQALPAVSVAVARADATVAALDPSGLTAPLADGVRTLRGQLDAVRDPLSGAAQAMALVPPMLGSDGERTWLVLLEQDAEARGTGGLVGAYAVVRADKGQLHLVRAAQRSTLGTAPIPAGVVPADVRSLWGTDLTGWADLNLSPHFPWTGQLVAAGWKARRGAGPLDYVAALDQHAVAALLAGTGPVTVSGATVDSRNAVTFLSRDVYLRYPAPTGVDAVTAELVQKVFARVAAGHVDLRKLVPALAGPVGQRRVLIWSARPDEQSTLEGLSVGGAIPQAPGPFVAAVVNNGGGNKLDAYLKVHTAYQPGRCVDNVRIGALDVTLDNTAPRIGLPPYVVSRGDLANKGLRNPDPGSNRILLDLYGPVGGDAPVVTLDGAEQHPVAGTDREHAVWRVVVPIAPGQRRTVHAVVVQPVGTGGPDPAPQVLVQPMVLPATASIGAAPSCGG